MAKNKQSLFVFSHSDMDLIMRWCWIMCESCPAASPNCALYSAHMQIVIYFL